MAGLNAVLSGKLQGQFVTAAYLFLDLQSGTGRYSAAGHPPLLHYCAADQLNSRRRREWPDSRHHAIRELRVEGLRSRTAAIASCSTPMACWRPTGAAKSSDADRVKQILLAAAFRRATLRFAEQGSQGMVAGCCRRRHHHRRRRHRLKTKKPPVTRVALHDQVGITCVAGDSGGRAGQYLLAHFLVMFFVGAALGRAISSNSGIDFT